MEDFNFPLEKDKKQNIDNLHQDGNYDILYRWLDKIPFSKRPKTLARDFSDGVLMAELLKLHYPRLLEIHQCITTNSVSVKKDNWITLNRKVFSKINLKLSNNTISQLANCNHGTIEKLLFSLLDQITNKDINSSQGPVQETDVDDNEEVMNDEVQEIIEENLGIESEIPRTLEDNEKCFSVFLEMGKNILNIFITFFMQVIYVWKWLGNLQIMKENLKIENKYISGNNYLYETISETAYINEEIDDTAARWAYEKLIEEIQEKEDMISTLNHKVAYLEGTMRQKDLQIANLMIQVTNDSVEVTSNLKQRSSTPGPIKLRPKTYNSQLMSNSYRN